MDHPKRPDNFTGVWINRHGTNARTEQEYVNGIANGSYRSILENGIVHREGYKKDGVWHGTPIVRNSDGEVLDTGDFVDGTGVYRIFQFGRTDDRRSATRPWQAARRCPLLEIGKACDDTLLREWRVQRGGRRSIAKRCNGPAPRRALC
ncbi:MAG TPA: hypothetical protein VK797_13840 [Tepidisphaeraceae bacterium]|nr:hypothetical protein [Tepidisphaeraceae bacterium]